MSIYSRGDPAANANYRATTQRNAGRLDCIQTVPKRCKCVRCGIYRTAATGKHTGRGFVCHGCGKGGN